MIMEFHQRFKALSMQCRYAGSVDRFYSVAEHTSVGVEVLQESCASEDEQRAFFLHDMPEGPYGDIITPVKRDPAVAARWDELEHTDFFEMTRRLDLPNGFMTKTSTVKAVKELDWNLFIAELFTVADDFVRGRSKEYRIDPDNMQQFFALGRIDFYKEQGADFGFQVQRLDRHFRRLFK